MPSSSRTHSVIGHRTFPALLGLAAGILGCVSSSGGSASTTTRHDAPWQNDLVRDSAGTRHHRIPALVVTRRGTLVAAYDSRPTLADLPGNIHLVVRRSTDHGRTWGPVLIARRADPPAGFGDPSLILDQSTGRLFLFHAAGMRQGFFGSHTGNDESDADILQADLSVSDDDGLTWRHRRITAQIKDPAWAGIFASSGAGIQIRRGPIAGRLVQQYVVRVKTEVFAASAFSDDHGEHWRMGALVGPGADENKVVELADGRLMLNSRSKPYRRIAYSNDGGATWSGWREERALVDPANNAAIIRENPDADPGSPRAHGLLFSNTEHPTQRRNLVLKHSCDDGATWPGRIVVDSGPAAYSTLARLRDGSLGVLYERDDYRAITFVRLPIPSTCAR